MFFSANYSTTSPGDCFSRALPCVKPPECHVHGSRPCHVHGSRPSHPCFVAGSVARTELAPTILDSGSPDHTGTHETVHPGKIGLEDDLLKPVIETRF